MYLFRKLTSFDQYKLNVLGLFFLTKFKLMKQNQVKSVKTNAVTFEAPRKTLHYIIYLDGLHGIQTDSSSMCINGQQIDTSKHCIEFLSIIVNKP